MSKIVPESSWNLISFQKKLIARNDGNDGKSNLFGDSKSWKIWGFFVICMICLSLSFTELKDVVNLSDTAEETQN